MVKIPSLYGFMANYCREGIIAYKCTSVYLSSIQHKSPGLLCIMEDFIPSQYDTEISFWRLWISSDQATWNESAINIQGFGFFCWMDERYSCMRWFPPPSLSLSLTTISKFTTPLMVFSATYCSMWCNAITFHKNASFYQIKLFILYIVHTTYIIFVG